MDKKLIDLLQEHWQNNDLKKNINALSVNNYLINDQDTDFLEKKFVLLCYLDNFILSDVERNAFEKQNHTKKEYFKKFELNNISLAQESSYYLEYQSFEKTFKPLEISEFEEILSSKLYKLYYKYYCYFIPLNFCVFKAYSIVLSSSKIKLSKDDGHLALTVKSKTYLIYITIVYFYECLEIDNFEQNRFYKKRLLKKLEEEVLNSINRKIFFNEPVDDLKSSTLDNLILSFKPIFIKICWLIEDILMHLCVGLPFINYSENHGTTVVETDLDIKNNTNSSELKNNSSLEEWKVEVEKTSTRYTMYGTRYLLFSKQVHFVKDMTLNVFKLPPILYDNKIEFDHQRKFEIFTYNLANPQNISEFKFNLDIVSRLISVPITFNKHLYESIAILFVKKFSKKTHISSKTKFHSLNEVFSQLFNGEDNVKLYFPYLVDFRGRIYINNPISITDVKLLRFVIAPYYSNTKKKSLKKNNFYNKILKYSHLLKLLKINIDNFSDERKVIVLLGLLNLGKIEKSKLLKDHRVHISDFIKRGIDLFNLDNNSQILSVFGINDLDDIACCVTLRHKINEYIRNGTLFSIIVDSTASGIFHLNLWLHIKEEYTKYINLNSEDYWYDTYSFLFKITKELMGSDFPSDLEHLFTRKRLKKLYMTVPYNATKLTLRRYFFSRMTQEELKLIKPSIDKFLNNIYLTFETIFCKNYKQLVLLNYFNNSYKFTLNNNYYDLTYYMTENVEYEVQVKGKRYTNTETKVITLEELIRRYESYKNESLKTNDKNQENSTESGEKENKSENLKNKKIKTKPLSNIDDKKSKVAFSANVMHCTDAAFLNKIYVNSFKNHIYIHTIHDEFIVPVDMYFEFLEIVNESYASLYTEVNNDYIKTSINSFFILL